MRLGGRIAAAIEVLDDMAARRRPVADALKDWGLSHRFAGSGDRAAIGNIVYDVLRRKRSLAWRMGDEGSTALAFAAVIEAGRSPVELAAALGDDRHAPAMPRPAQLDCFITADLADAPPSVRADVPDWLETPFERAFGAAWVDEAAALGDRPPLDMRVNVLKSERREVAAMLSPFGAEPTRHAPYGLRIPPIEGDGRHPNVQVEAAFQTGLFEIQDEGSQIVSELCGARPGETILDYCAGAGGKTLALAASLQGDGTIHAYDADRQRLAPIWERLTRAGVANVTVHAPRDDLAALLGAMDRVVVDAPCTGTGTWRRRPDARWRLTPQQLERRIAEQDAVLDKAAPFVRAGGRLVYITCSLLAEENVERIEAFLGRTPDFRLCDAETVFHDTFADKGAPFLAEQAAGGSTLTLTPRRTGTDAFFFAALERNPS